MFHGIAPAHDNESIRDLRGGVGAYLAVHGHVMASLVAAQGAPKASRPSKKLSAWGNPPL